jgi:hypothetical protein
MLERSGSQSVPVPQRVGLLRNDLAVWQRAQMASQSEALRRTFDWKSVKRSLKVALIIGTILNSINQGPEILTGHWPVWWKLILTYFTPFAVASYGSYAAFRSSE